MLKQKTRDLSIYKFFEQLEKEYIVAELRRKIYAPLQDKKYYKKVMFFKKEKIIDIALRNSLPSIFDDEATKIKFYLQIYKKSGFPNFIYNSESEKGEFEQKDKLFYYMEGSDVKVDLKGEIFIGLLKSVSFKTNTAIVNVNGTESMIALDYITRIL